MIKTFRLMLLAAFTMLCGSTFAAETVVTWVAADQGYANQTEVTTMNVDDNITMVANKGTNSTTPKYFDTGAAIRLYGGNTLAVNGVEGVNIKKIVQTIVSGGNNNEITTDVETYNNGTWMGESQNVVFTIGGTSGHRRIAAVEVTYEVAEAAATESSVTWNASSEVSQGFFNVGDDLTLKWEEGIGDQAPMYNSTKTAVAMKKNNKLTVAGADANVTISEIVITYDKSSDLGLSANVGSTSNSNDNNTTTWTGEANSITFTASGTRYIKSIKVTYTGKAASVVKAPVLNITNSNIADTYDMDANSVFVVYYENTGNAAAENAALTLYVDGKANKTETIGQIAMGATNKWKNMKYDVTNLSAGEHQVYLSLTADNADAFTTEAKTVTFTKAAPEATFSVTAENVTVPYDATSFEVKATVTNTSEVAATGVQVLLQRNLQNVVDPQSLDFAANETKQVTFTIAAPEGGFTAGETKYWVIVKANEKTKAQQEVTVTVEEAPFVEKKDLAITEILGTLDLGKTTNDVRISVQNNGNVDITDAPVTLKAGENTLGTATVSATAGQYGWCTIAVASEGLEAGELAVTATVEVEGDETPADNTMEATLTVNAAAAPEATFTVTAEDVTVPFDATSFEIKATVKNTSEVTANGLTVQLLKGITEVDSKTLNESLAPGAEVEVTFTITEIDKNAQKYYVRVGSNALAEVTVTYAEAPVAQTVDMALTQIQGVQEINLNQENTVLVWYKNEGNVATTATISATLNGTALTAQTVENVAADAQNYAAFTLPVEGLTAGETATFEATIAAEGDTNTENNTLSKTLNIVSGEVVAEPTFTVTAQNIEVLTTVAKVKAVVNVKNTSEVKANQVEVKLLNGMTQIGESQWIFGLEAGADRNVTFEFDNFDNPGTYQIQAIAGNYSGFFDVVVKAPVPDLAIESITGTINLANTSSNIYVNVKNNGTADVKNALVTMTAGETVLGAGSVAYVKAGETSFASITVYSESLTAGELEVTATVEVEGDPTPMDNTLTTTLTVNAAPAAEATFAVTAENVTVPFGAENFNIVAKVKNTSEVAGDVDVKLLKGVTLVDTKTVENLAAGAEQEVTFTLNEIGEAGKTATYYVQAGTSQQEVTVTFEKEAVAEVKDLAIESIAGTIDLSATSSNVTVTVKNNGNVDVKNAKVTLSYGETVLEKTVSVKANENGYAFFQVSSEGITGETLAVTAKVELEGDATPADNEKTENLTVNAAAAAEATFSVTAENVTVPYDATSFEIKATVKNTSEVTANGLTVKLLKGITEVETKTLNESLAPGAEVEVTFTITEIDKTAQKYYVQVEGKAQAEVTVTYAEAPVAQTVDMALTQIQGVSEINLSEENSVMVWYKNEGNVATTATISATLNGTVLTAQTVENVAAEAQNYVTFTLPVEGLTAGETATFEATITAEGDTNAENNTLSKTLNIVSGETEPAAEIAINPISGWEVEAGEQEVSVTVTLFNNGEVEAKDVKVELYKSYGDNLCEPQTVDVPVGEGTNWKNITFRFNYTFEAGKDYEFTAYTNYVDADNSNQMQKFTLTCPVPVADVAIAKIANIEATTEDNVKVNATLKNNSTFAAKEVKVGVYKVEDLEYKLVGIQQTVEEIAAGEEAGVEFNLGQMEAGNYTYYVRILSIDGTTVTTTRDVTIKVSEPVVPVIDVALTQMSLTNGHIDLAAASNILTLWVENKGNVAADATVNVTLNGTALESHSVNLKAGKSNSTLFALPTEGLVAGQKATIVATVNVEGNTSETTTVTKEYDIVDSAVATEPVFEVTAQDVEVEWGAEKFDVVATVKNVSEVNAENITVSLFYNSTIATQTISVLANNETTVTFADVQNPFAKAGEYTMYVQAPKTQAEVKITVKPEPVVPVIDMALTTIHGLGKIDLQAENKVSVWYKNEGNVDAQGVTIKVAVNGSEGETKAINAIVKPEETGYIEFTLPTDGLTAGETATVVATVTIEGDANAENNSVEQSYEVVDGTPVEPTFSVTAENVTVEYGAESFNIVATIKNTSEVTANGLTVRLLKGITEVETKTLNESLAAGAEVEVTFTVAGPFEAGTTAYYYVQVAEAQANVEVTFAEEPVQQVIDLAITSISGTPSLDATAYLTVFVENKGNVDVQNATVTLKAGEKLLGTGTVSPKAGGSSFCSIAVAADKLTVGENTFTATVEVEGDVDLTNNTLEKTYTLTAEPVLSFTVNDITVGKNDTEMPVAVIVKNTGKGVAKNVAVKVYSEAGAELGSTTIETIAAGGEKTALIMITNTFTDKGKLQIWVAGVDGVKWVNVTVTESTAIAAIKAQYGENVKIYTLTGKLVDNVKKGGLYIVNGKKMVVK